MRQLNIPFQPHDFVKGRKFLVYADLTYARDYFPKDDDSDDMGIGSFHLETKTEYKHEQVLLGVVDNDTDIVDLVDRFKITDNKFDWRIDKQKLHAMSIDYFYVENNNKAVDAADRDHRIPDISVSKSD